VSVLPRMRRAAAAPVRRRWWDLGWLALGAALLVLSGLPVSAHSISAAETGWIRLVNHLPSAPFAIVWAPMQLGNFLIVPAAVVAALAFRRWLLAAVRLLLGTRAGTAGGRAG
jgi:hypothetical protein